MSHPHFHQHVRKRLHKKLAPFPHPIRWKRQLDRSIAIFGALTVFATLPQVIEIWSDRDAGSVSEISWGYYTLFGILMLAYGIVHEERPIIITYSLNTVAHLAVLIGAILY